ncbi:hypothetical protein ISP13_15705 [Dyella lipolytica]|uniref:Cu and Ag efflux protein CusF n=2 Tax=Dyella lipolytica TaxID=1867835 RepID=A0ABW8IYG6_9GAMM
MTISNKSLCSMLGSLSLAVAFSGVALAQDSMPASSTTAMSRMSTGAMHPGMKSMHTLIGMHAMPATVSAVDTHTGVVDVTSEGMALKVHFPPAAMADLKAGDTITLHMGYSKP